MLVLGRFQLFYVLALIYWVNAEEQAENPFSHVVKHTLITTARNCMTHVNATEADLEHLRDEPPYPEKSACILKCLLEKIGIVKNNKYSKWGFLTAVTPLVFTNKKKLEHMKTVSENCDNEINHHEVEPCQLGNEVVTCIFKYAPELHLKA
ncbi:PBP/GOBP family domain-containing protein [Phthorimaea operculella]|nr:PBP/GOBP family domain-containing protein [Phthorimaea operculella]